MRSLIIGGGALWVFVCYQYLRLARYSNTPPPPHPHVTVTEGVRHSDDDDDAH